jgi:hypothetical protein
MSQHSGACKNDDVRDVDTEEECETCILDRKEAEADGLGEIAQIMTEAREWNSDTLDDIAAVCKRLGYNVDVMPEEE